MKWKTTIDIKKLMNECRDDTPEAINKLGNQVSDLLAKQDAFFRPSIKIINDFKKVDDNNSFNAVLEKLYDWADINGVWLGL